LVLCTAKAQILPQESGVGMDIQLAPLSVVLKLPMPGASVYIVERIDGAIPKLFIVAMFMPATDSSQFEPPFVDLKKPFVLEQKALFASAL
jgi:hypothetical protein